MMSGFLSLSILNWALVVINVKKAVRERHANICNPVFSKLHVKCNPKNNTNVANVAIVFFFLRK